MRRLTPLIVLVIAAVSFLALRPATTTDVTAVEGVWKIVHFTVTTDEGTVEGDIDQPNLMIFAARHYASIFPSGGGGEMNAQGGTYEMKGNEIHFKIIATSRTESPAGERSATFQVDGGTLVMTYTDGPVVTFTRVE